MKTKLYIYSQFNYLIRTAKRRLLLNRPTDRTFENRLIKKVRPCTFFISEFCLGKTLKVEITAIRGGEAYRVYVEDTFLPCDAADSVYIFKSGDGAMYSLIFGIKIRAYL